MANNSKKLEALVLKLVKGSKAFIDNPKYQAEREKVKNYQDPHFIVVSCSDSQVSVPIIFNNLHLGTFFEIKTAGQVLTSSDLESIKYAVDNYNSLAIIMLGHTNCGAVESTVESIISSNPERRAEIRNAFPTITTSIAPAVHKALKVDHRQEDLVLNAIVENIFNKTRELEFLFGNRISIIPALYDLITGKVTFSDKPNR